MNPILSINMFRPASVQLDTVTQSQQKKVDEAERKKAEQPQQTQQTALQETPAAEYTPGTTASAYPVGQDEGVKRKVFVDPVTVPGTLSAKISQDKAETEENDHEVQVAERIDRVTQAKAMADRIAPPVQRQKSPEENDGFMTQTIVTVRTTAKETPAEKAIDPVYQNAPPVETQLLKPELTQSTDVKDTITEPKRASERENPVPRSPRSVDSPRARRERPEIRPAERKPREVEAVDRAKEQEPQAVKPVSNTEEEEPFALKPISGSEEQEAQAVGTMGGNEAQAPQAVGTMGGNEAQAPQAVGTMGGNEAQAPQAVGTMGGNEAQALQAVGTMGGNEAQQPEAVGAVVGTEAQQPEAVGAVGGTGIQQPQAVGTVGATGTQQPEAVSGTGTQQPQAVGQAGNNPEEPQTANQVGTGTQKTDATDAQKAAKAEEAKKAEQAEKTEKDQKAQEEKKAQQKEQTEKDQKAEKARKAEEVKKKRTAAAKKIKQDMQHLKAQIVRERNPKTAEELSIQLVQMNAKLRQVNSGEPVSLLFK